MSRFSCRLAQNDRRRDFQAGDLAGRVWAGAGTRDGRAQLDALPTDHPAVGASVEILLDHDGTRDETPMLANTWEPDARGEFCYGVVEAVDPDTVQIDPLSYL